MILPQIILIFNVALVLFITIDGQSAASHTDAHNRSPPVFAKQHPNIYVFEIDENGNHQNIILPCPINTPSETISYTWFKGNQELPESMVNGEGSLVIPNITEGEYASREGVDYYCIATDYIGYSVAVRSRTITVYYAFFDGFRQMAEPGESTVKVSVPVALNSDVALECDVLDANPPPQIKWYNDMGAIQEETQSNRVRFLDSGRYLYLSRLQATHLERLYYCSVTNANLSQEIAASIRYILTDNITQGVLVEYKQIGNLRAFVGNRSIEFAFVGGVFGDNVNETINTLSANDNEVAILGKIGIIYTISIPGMVRLEAVVRYNGGLTAVRSGTMNIFQVPRIINTIQDDRDLLVGEGRLTYTCQFEGTPLPIVIFYFNGTVISSDNGVIIINNTLIIPSPQVSHSGVYQCIVSNEFGDDQRAWFLEIREPIFPKVQPLNFTELGAFDDRDLGALIVSDNGSTIGISVDVMADPCPDIVWIFNGTALGPSYSNNAITYSNSCRAVGNRSLIWTYMLSVVLTSETSGQFLANFTNIAGTAFLPRIYFTVPVPTSITRLSLNDTCLKEGSSVSIRCNVRGFPRPRIEFHRNNVAIEFISEIRMFENILLEFYDQIVIKNVTMNDEGLYSCSIFSVTGTLPQVTQKQFDFCTLPQITDVDYTTNPLVGEPFFIECTVDGIPQPSTIWMKDGALLEETQNDANIRIVTIARKSSRVEVSKASIDDSGKYQCIVDNTAGSVMHFFTIKLIQAHIPKTGGGHAAPLSLGLIVGITVGVIVLISAALFVVLVCIIICRLRVNNKKYEAQIASIYSANIAYYSGTLEHQRELHDPLYDIIPYTDPAEVRTNEKARIYKRAHIYEKVYEDFELTKQPSKDKAVNPKPGNTEKNIPKDEILNQVSENTDKDNPTGITKSSPEKDNEQQEKKSPEIQSQTEQETILYSDPQKCTNSKHPHSGAEGDMVMENVKADFKSNSDVDKGVGIEFGVVGDEPTQVYATEHKTMERMRLLHKQQKGDWKEKDNQGNTEIKKESEKLKEEIECKDEKSKVNMSKEGNMQLQGAAYCES